MAAKEINSSDAEQKFLVISRMIADRKLDKKLFKKLKKYKAKHRKHMERKLLKLSKQVNEKEKVQIVGPWGKDEV